MGYKGIGILLTIVVAVGYIAFLTVTAPSPEEEISGVWEYEEGTKESKKPSNVALSLKFILEVKKFE